MTRGVCWGGGKIELTSSVSSSKRVTMGVKSLSTGTNSKKAATSTAQLPTAAGVAVMCVAQKRANAASCCALLVERRSSLYLLPVHSLLHASKSGRGGRRRTTQTPQINSSSSSNNNDDDDDDDDAQPSRPRNTKSSECGREQDGQQKQ